MGNQMRTLPTHPPATWVFGRSEQDRKPPLFAVKDRSLNFLEPACRNIDRELGRPIRKILVPTDFSSSSTRVVECAAALARQSDAALTILHVIDINPPSAPRHCGTADDLMRQLSITGASELAQLKKTYEQTQVRIQTLLVEGLPYEAIVENSSGFDLLVMSEPGRNSSWNVFSRHTARRVIEQARCPVRVLMQDADADRACVGFRTKIKATA